MELLEIGKLFLLLIAGVVAGFVNTLAGGGSLLTIPALIFLGIPSPVANGTNRVAILLQNVVSTIRFGKKGELDLREGFGVALPGVFGAVVGASIGATVSQELFDTILGIVLLLVLATLFLPKPQANGEGQRWMRSMWVKTPVFFLIGVYAGFVQAGVGFLLISGITLLLGKDLVKTNAIKVLVVLLFTAVSLLIFSLYGRVLWGYGLLLAVGTMGGAWIGVNFALRRGAGAIRWVIVGAVALSSLRLFGLL